MTEYNILGQKIKELRKKSGMSQEELAGAVNISTSFLSRIETAKENPSLDSLIKLAKALKISLYQLFKTEDNTKAITSELSKIEALYVRLKPDRKQLAIKILKALSK